MGSMLNAGGKTIGALLAGAVAGIIVYLYQRWTHDKLPADVVSYVQTIATCIGVHYWPARSNGGQGPPSRTITNPSGLGPSQRG